MRKLLLLASAFVAACGSSSNSGGGPLAGTVGGRAFHPADVQAILAGTGSAPCPVPVLGDIGVKAFALEVTSFADVCGDFATPECKSHVNAQSVMILFARLNAVPPYAEPTLPPGSYTVYESPTISIADPGNPGLRTVAYAQALATDATCAGNPSPAVRGGTLRLDQVTGPITGHVSLTFDDGSALAGDFSAPTCPGVTPDVCALATTQTLCTLPATACPAP